MILKVGLVDYMPMPVNNNPASLFFMFFLWFFYAFLLGRLEGTAAALGRRKRGRGLPLSIIIIVVVVFVFVVVVVVVGLLLLLLVLLALLLSGTSTKTPQSTYLVGRLDETLHGVARNQTSGGHLSPSIYCSKDTSSWRRTRWRGGGRCCDSWPWILWARLLHKSLWYWTRILPEARRALTIHVCPGVCSGRDRLYESKTINVRFSYNKIVHWKIRYAMMILVLRRRQDCFGFWLYLHGTGAQLPSSCLPSLLSTPSRTLAFPHFKEFLAQNMRHDRKEYIE
jgi:hypothetical protein